MLLAIDTCASTGSIALGRPGPEEGDAEILARAELPGRTYSSNLVPAIDEMLASLQATMADIDAIAVVSGPGSFTGIRVGLSTAKGLAEASGTPLIALSRLALLAHVSGLPHVLAVVDAGRGEYYVGEYRDGQKLTESLLGVEDTAAAARRPGAGILVCEEFRAPRSLAPGSSGGASGLAGHVNPATGLPEGPAFPQPVWVRPPDAEDALEFALARFRAGEFENVETLDANYLRRSDAELFGAAGKKGAAGLGLPKTPAASAE